MSATARAEARRNAILKRGTDRLAKLTTSARGEDAPAYMHDKQSPANLTSGIQAPAAARPSGSRQSERSFDATPAPPDPSIWSQEQQVQFMQALMGAGLAPSESSNQPQFLDPPMPSIEAVPPADDPLTSLMSSLSQMNPQGQSPFNIPGTATAQPTNDTKPPSFIRRFVPLIHILATWCLLAYFVLWREPEAFMSQPSGAALPQDQWSRWAELAWRNAKGARAIQPIPFFWAFTTLQLILHSFRVFSGFDTIKPPTLLSLALPHLPSPFPTLILTGMKYMQLGGALLDDLAALIVALGLFIWAAGWIATGIK